MRTFLLLVALMLIVITPAWAEFGFDEKYERDYNIFNPINQLRPDNPLNPINSVDPKNPFNPINSVDPGNPANPINEVNPNNPLNPINRYNPNTPFRPLNTFPDHQRRVVVRETGSSFRRSTVGEIMTVRSFQGGDTTSAKWETSEYTKNCGIATYSVYMECFPIAWHPVSVV